ncbi:hypothetical protein AVEN_21624-1 [Araneus ventricosus]|uniref:Uncharacterized protein n=1 Tax=Araneus ventricosus TaxID=182803 RepID=A0A4Y2G4Q8_ARAVE|nr:hypothetical protein AVEN_21624-1 [Araneus ventricosus]
MVYIYGFLSNMVYIYGFLSNMVSSDGFLSNLVSSDGFLSNMMSKSQPYSQRILEISLPRRFLPQNDRKCIGRGYQENPHFRLEAALAGECCRMWH